ncbi:hypothetical protein MP228_008904 [Amoeboaphelidium protococcarum]|nr:hypothetical protein MP228_008904 [Amoeboaphelidium protococcarum]
MVDSTSDVICQVKCRLPLHELHSHFFNQNQVLREDQRGNTLTADAFKIQNDADYDAIDDAECEMYLYQYRNSNGGIEEHIAVVFPPNQIQSRSLNIVHQADENDYHRRVRGAFSTANVYTLKQQTRFDNVLTRIHSACFTGEVLNSCRCDCGHQLHESLCLLSQKAQTPRILLYLNQEGRSIGLMNKMKAYNLQDMGHDTVEANQLLGFQDDERDYRVAALIYQDLNVASVRLLTNNQRKVDALINYGIQVSERVPFIVLPSPGEDEVPSKMQLGGDRQNQKSHNQVVRARRRMKWSIELQSYIKTKIEKLGHLIQPLIISTSDENVDNNNI